MATLKQIQFKRSKVAGVRPTPAQLAEGELAINLKDRLLFTKDDTGAIIDLGFAKGGNIDGNVIHNGNYNQTGDYALKGAFTQTGSYTTSGSITANGDITAKSRLMTDNGEVLVRGAGTTHVRFQDLADARERGIIYSQNRAGDTKQILNVRVQDYTNSTSNIFAFNGDGLFYAPSISGGTSVKSPIIYTNKVITDGKAAGDYDISSLSNNTPLAESETAINHLRVMRNAVGAGIFHEVNVNDGIAWYSGDGLDTYLWSFTWSGGLKAGHSISVGLPGGPKGYSELGTASIALGDNNTGLKWKQDGQFHTVNNGAYTLLTTPTEVTSLKQLVAGYSTNGSDLILPTAQNYPLVIVNTTNDKNGFGDGQTLLGYHQSGKYHHYFRGKGVTNVNTDGGLLVTPGNVEVRGGSVNIDGRGNASTVIFKGSTTGYSSVDNIELKGWGDTFNTVGGSRKNVLETSDATGWMHYIQRTTAGKVESYLNGTMNIVEGLSVSQDTSLKRNLYVSNEIKVRAASGLRIWNDKYGVIFRNSEDQLHIIPTNANAGESGGLSPLRPLSIMLDTGRVKIPNLEADQVYFRGNGALEFPNSNGASYANQNTTKAPLYQALDAATQAFYPITKQKNIDSNVTVTQGMDRATSEYRIVAQGDLLGDGDATGLKYWRFTKEGNFMAQNRLYAGTAYMNTDGNIAGSIWKKYSGATNLDAAVNTRVGKGGDTMTGRLTLKTNSDAIVINSAATESGYLKGQKAGIDNWYVGNGGADNAVSIYSFQTNSGVNINADGDIALNPQGSATFNFNRDRLFINGSVWASHQAGDWGNQWKQEAPVFVDFGNVGNDSYYPIIKGKSGITNEGFISGVDFGMRRITNNWAQGIIRVGNQENGSDPQAIYEFHHNGVLYVPNMVKTGARLSAGGGDPVWAGPCLVIGDNDTGLVHGGDGRINMVANGMHIASWSSAYHIHEGLWDTTGALWTEQGRAIMSYGHLVQANDSYSTYVRDVYVRSDIRVKKDLVKFENASDKLSKINGYTYMQKRGMDEEGNQKWEPNAGLIAQEVQAILPELVEGDPDGEALLRLNYNGVIGLNTAAINEHTAEIAELKSEIEELKKLVKSLLK
ncbi:long tail fiber distal subunit [Enterobacteria phage vB_EcoM_IME281]|uniref:Long tail fiber protein Gp37 n=1 Tax=Enterobacteria phage vB_EcoM_IME281 TaxID=2163887 RepID=A0A2S1GNS3_9CAUD|nr:long tail fiber protein distal subunit [Enterobacteria phage vB_EcoM_IME281]AWD91036.1 long tail fiber distal subunit [Enterobacteria phage vB_EcoM_IME281]